jgi:hypothetical protein
MDTYYENSEKEYGNSNNGKLRVENYSTFG